MGKAVKSVEEGEEKEPQELRYYSIGALNM